MTPETPPTLAPAEWFPEAESGANGEEMEIKVLKSCKCGEFEKRIVELEWEIEKKSIEYHELEAKFKELGERGNGLANEVNDLRANIVEVIEVDGVVDLTAEEEEDKMMQ
ncbi:hypothetical protein SADUNF_Sadunf15G0020100 [Salix dunnii]|uniref:Uncharacterized protein n=1 Tax=Salix dunnii TaxID=1413687 RepID=A0A835JBN4_9ROSI|nr:hypothetical protein SADUNF_Sadunf15G0020100 [Salix dunnii]